MKIAWVTRSFLDYRIPVFAEFDKLTGGGLHLIYSGDYVPETVSSKALDVLGQRALAMTDEMKWGSEDKHFLANRNFSFRWQPGLLAAMRQMDPDVVVCDGFFKWTLPALMYKVPAGKPLVINYERTHHTERHAQCIRTLYRKLVVGLTNAMDCSGRLCKEYTVSLGMPPERITLGHMSADTDSLAAAAAAVSVERIRDLRAQYGARGVLFLYVGRLEPWKGVVEMLQAWAASRLGDAEASLLVIGDGEQRCDLESIVTQHELTNVHLAGRIPYDELPAYYAAADAFLIATLEDNWSLVVPEAMACRLPILTSKYNGCWPELVQEGQNGWVLDPLDQDGMVAGLKAAIAEGSALASMGARSHEIVCRHGPRQAAQSVLDACQIAIAHKQGGAIG